MRIASLPRAFVGFLGLASALSLLAIPAMCAAQSRIHADVTSGTRAEIADSVHPRARTATDLGATADDTKLSMSLRFSMTDAQSAALDQLLADQQNPASPRYHQWLTPAQFGAQFGLSDADIATVTAWLGAQGFTVTGVGNGRTFVTFDGDVAQANAAFGTSIHNVLSRGEQHYANLTNITLPGALASVVGSATGLSNFRPHAHLGTVSHPQFTSSVSGTHYVAPGDFYAIYDMEPLLTAGYTGAGIGTGSNCHSTGSPSTCGDIAVLGQVDLYNNSTSDVLAFRSAAGLSTTNLPTTVLAGADPGQARACNGCYPSVDDLDESSIDVEWSGAMAPAASILFVTGTDVMANSMTTAIDNNLAPIITTSYGGCETGWGSTELNSYNQLFRQAASQGQTIVTSSGDSGATDCDTGTLAVEGLTADFPASSPYVTAMGGSMFNEGSTTGVTPYWLSPDTTFTAGSAVPAADVSAKGYIPEAVWNEDSTAGSGAGGGGVSAFFAKPAWQVETGASGMTTTVPADSSRDEPDLALNAASEHDGMLFCVQGSCVVGFRATSGGGLTVAGGTSFDSQAFGGMLADIEQKVGPTVNNGPRLGVVNPTLYALGNQVAYYNNTSSSVFHDITVGNNSNPCGNGTPNCPNGGNIGYNAGTGYDLATGWGSVDLNNLATDWKLVTPESLGSNGTAISTTTLATTPACTGGTTGPCTVSVAAASSVTLTATVTGSAGTPTGTVQFLDNNVALGSPVNLGSGVATYTYTPSCSTLGQQYMTAVYSGSTTYAGSKGPALPTGQAGYTGGTTITGDDSVNTTPLIVTVTSSICPDFSLAPSGTNTSTATISVSGTTAAVNVSAGGTVPPVTITVTPSNGFAGTVNFTASVVATSGYLAPVTFNPTSLTFSGSSSAPQTTIVTLSGIVADLHLPGAPGSSKPVGRPWYAAGSGVAIASLFLIAFPRRRRLGGLLMVLVAAGLAFGVTGCGGSSQQSVSGGGGNTTNPYAGSYTVTVTATYSNGGQTSTHSSVITYLIQ